MNYVNHHPGKMSVKQKEAKISLMIKDISSVSSAIKILSDIRQNSNIHNQAS
jgi:hypothetical protein